MNLYLACLVVLVSVGASVVWSDRRNLVSQAFALMALNAAAWLCVYWTIRTPWRADPVPWLRAAAAIGDFFPWVFWWMGRCIIYPRGTWRDFFVAGRFWMVAGALLAALAMSQWYIPDGSTPANKLFGPGYAIHQVGQLALFLALPVYGLAVGTKLRGIPRFGAMLFYVGGGTLAVSLAAIEFLAPRLGRPELAPFVPVLASAFYVAAAWAVSGQQLLDARLHLLTVLRRAAGLIGAAFVITRFVDHPSELPRELHFILAAAAGVTLALLFDSISGALINRSIAKDSLGAARALQRFATHVAALPAAELRETAAQRLSEILSTREVVVYWRSGGEEPMRLVSANHGAQGCPPTLDEDHVLLQHSVLERSPWWLARRLSSIDASLSDFALCVPVLEHDHVQLVVLVGHKRGPLGFTQSEISAIEAWALACHHTLTTRALLERENAQQQLVYAGKLAAGIAHNLRNPLAVVRAFLEADPTIPVFQLRELHSLAANESSRIQSTVDGLAALSRGERFALSAHDPAALIARAIELNRAYLAECGARIEVAGAADAPPILAEPWQLTTALTNLLRNSAEEIAREGGGSIRVEIESFPPNWLEIRVRDSGRGLPAHIRDAVFSRDLFAQTTKSTSAPGRRTGFGVGLHSTMLIVTIGHGGRFEYRDGAFVITLPMAAAALSPGRE